MTFRPVTQIRTGYGRGQCTEASIASILGVDLEAVPDIWAGPGVPDDAPPEAHQPMEKLVAMWDWLKREHGVMECGVRLAGPRDIESAWLRAKDLFPIWARYHLACGPNPDGVSHLVVCERGRMVHDPNPRRRGIAECNWVGWLVPLDLVPDDARHLPSAEWREEAA